MIKLTLTQFLSYANAGNHSERITALKQIKKQINTGYDPASDFYKGAREAIIESKGTKVARVITHEKKQVSYDENLTGWNSFVGKKKLTSKPVRRKEWVYLDLTVNVGPEIALEINGITTFYKLWFKKDVVTKRNAEIIYQLLHEILLPKSNEQLGILNLRRHQVVTQPVPLPTPLLSAGLKAEATHFITLWSAM
jgi:hypothetical protein